MDTPTAPNHQQLINKLSKGLIRPKKIKQMITSLSLATTLHGHGALSCCPALLGLPGLSPKLTPAPSLGCGVQDRGHPPVCHIPRVPHPPCAHLQVALPVFCCCLGDEPVVSVSQLCPSEVRQLPWGVWGHGGDTALNSGTGCAALVGVLGWGDGLAARTTLCPFPGLVPGAKESPAVPRATKSWNKPCWGICPGTQQCAVLAHQAMATQNSLWEHPQWRNPAGASSC